MDGILHFNTDGLLLQVPLYSLDPNDRSDDPWDLPGHLAITAGRRVSLTINDAGPFGTSYEYDRGTAMLELVVPQGRLTGAIPNFDFTVFDGDMPDATPLHATDIENVQIDAALASYIGSTAAMATFDWYADGFQHRAYNPPNGQMEARIYYYNPFFRLAPAADCGDVPCEPVPAPGAFLPTALAFGWAWRRRWSREPPIA